MEFKKLGGSGIEVSMVGIGCNNFGRRINEADSRAVILDALDAGINFFDTAENYGDGQSELFLGKALGARRQDAVIATKFGWGGDAVKSHIDQCVDASLRRLGTDYIDLYQIHRPDPRTPIAETLEAMDALIRAGKVRAIGCSNFSGAQLEEALEMSRAYSFAPFATAQNEYNVMNRSIERDLLGVCRDNNVGILPFYPLNRGLLTGKYSRDSAAPRGTRLGDGGVGTGGVLSAANFDQVEKLQAFVDSRGRSLLELALSFLAMQPEIPSVIAGARRPGQAAENVRLAGWKLSDDDLAELNALTL
jgi:aryl-alcohol dehydrogenase-like predicted oxidoreductase